MKKFMMMAASAAILAMGAGGAQAANQDINITATVVGYCSVTGASTASVSFGTVSGDTNGSVSGTIPSLTVICNNSSDVTLASANGAVTLLNGEESTLASAPSGFKNKINYTASINGGAGLVTLDTSLDDTNAVDTVTGPFTTGASSTIAGVTITPTSSSPNLLLAGSYSDVLSVTVTPDP